MSAARISFLRSVLPGLFAFGNTTLAAQYGVELARLEGRSPENVVAEFDECAREGHEHGAEGNRCIWCQVQL